MVGAFWKNFVALAKAYEQNSKTQKFAEWYTKGYTGL